MRQKRIILIGYKIGSRSLKNLQVQLREDQEQRRVLRVRRNSTRYQRRATDKIVAWGPTLPSPHVDQAQEAAKKIASNKLLSFRKFSEHNISHPDWTIDPVVAAEWRYAGHVVVARHLLTSHSGNGIELLQPLAENEPGVTPNAKLYVKYKKKKHEYRVHVFQSTVIDVTQKKRRQGFEGRDNQIRNHQNGWIYARENIHEPEGLRQLALDACAAIGLWSGAGAVDIIWNEYENRCYVLEINSAPGIQGTTCKKYSAKIIEGL